MLKYPVHLKKDEASGYVVTFPDIPKAIAQGKDETEAMQAAQSALETALDFYFDEALPVPVPSKPQPGQPVVELSASLSDKVLRLNEMLAPEICPTGLMRAAPGLIGNFVRGLPDL